MTNKTKARVVFLALAAALSACSRTKQARSVKEPEKSLLGLDYSMMQEGKEGQALKVYNSGEDLSRFKNLILEPIVIAPPEGAKEDDIADLKKLSDDAAATFKKELEQDWTLVKDPGPDTLRLQVAFYDPDKRWVGVNAISSVMPIGIGLSMVKNASTGKASAVGELSAEGKLTNSADGKLYIAALDRRIANKYTKGAFSRWGDVQYAIDYYSKAVRYRLCEQAHRSNCVKPESE